MLYFDGILKEEYFWVSGRKIFLLDIWKRFLEEYEKEGFVRDYLDVYYDKMIIEEIINWFKEFGELVK